MSSVEMMRGTVTSEDARVDAAYNRRDVHSVVRHWKKWITREAIRWVIKGLVSWEPMREPKDGYTVVIGCSRKLLPMLPANLMMLARQEMRRCDRVLVVVDACREELPAGFEASVRGALGGVASEVVCYDAKQAKVSRWFDWGWVYCWLSWVIGLKAAKTRHVVIHDFDALLLRPGLIEERYEDALRTDAQYHGVGCYVGNGIVREDGFIKTFEMVLDAAYFREKFRPIDVFNRTGMWRGHRVEFDTFIWPQTTGGKKVVMEMLEEDMVHPSQMICQFVDHTSGRGLPRNHNLMMIPYYESLGGDESLMREVTARIGRGGGVELWGRAADVKGFSALHSEWMRVQAERLEERVLGAVRPAVREYFEAIERERSGGNPG